MDLVVIVIYTWAYAVHPSKLQHATIVTKIWGQSLGTKTGEGLCHGH